MKTAMATMRIDVNVRCPHCNLLVELLNPEYTNGYDHNEEGGVLNQAYPSDYYVGQSQRKEFSVEDVTCSGCKNSFNVKGLEW